MIVPDKPDNEAARLKALESYNILDTLPEEDYDTLTRLAAYICQTPVALISLVHNERQWFKSAHGFSASETPRDVAFCAHNILAPSSMLVVEDASKDARFAANPLVTESPGIAFYAGVPIVDPEGHALGSLCVIDTKPHQLDEQQRRALRDLTGQVVNLLKLRKANKALSQSERQFRTFADNLQNLAWIADADGWIFWYNQRWYDYTGTTLEEMQGWGWQTVHHPDHIGRVLAEVSELWKKDEPFELLFPLRAKDGAYRWFLTRAVPVFDEAGKKYQWIGTNTDVTEQVDARDALAQSERQFRTLIEQAPMATCLFRGKGEHVIDVANDEMLKIWGKTRDAVGKPLLEAVPELVGQPFADMLDNIYETGQPITGTGTPAQLEINGVLNTYYFDFTYQPLFDEEGKVYAIMDMASDVTNRVLARKKLEESEARLRTMITSAPAAICIFLGADMLVTMPNDAFIEVVGKGPDIAGKPLGVVLPELAGEGQPFLDILKDVYQNGKTFRADAALAKIVRDGVLTDNYFNITFSPLRDADGNIYGILDISINVTDAVLAHQKLAEREKVLTVASDLAELGNWTMHLPSWDISFAPRIAGWFGIDGDKADAETLIATIVEEDRERVRAGLEHAIKPGTDGVYAAEYTVLNSKTGEQKIISARGQVVLDNDGSPVKVEGTARDVTAERTYQSELEEKEASLRNAIELAELVTWTVDVATGKATYSARLQEWLGRESSLLEYETSPNVHPDDRDRIAVAVRKALQKGGDGRFDEVYTILNTHTGAPRIIHASGQAHYDKDGNAFRLSGTAQDITIQKDLQAALEQEVQMRTEELAAAVEELQAINEELEDSNNQLLKSNEELAQYAYVASHDLQEPLRKIQVFSGLLERKPELDPDTHNLVSKIGQSSNRMGLLIRDLLDFSRLLSADTLFRPTDLNEIVAAVFSDFELMGQEKNATFRIGELPTLQAVGLQMNQLFYNLVSNGLKFSKPDAAPLIEISAEAVSAEEAGKYIQKPLPFAQYHRICVQDNGIGFDQQYAEQIFEVFKRLHGRDVYPGSGIGLALCRRIIANHHGALYTESLPDKGATFCLILPDKQDEHLSSLPEGLKW